MLNKKAKSTFNLHSSANCREGRSQVRQFTMKIIYLVFALGLLCTVACAATIPDEEKLKDRTLNGIKTFFLHIHLEDLKLSYSMLYPS